MSRREKELNDECGDVELASQQRTGDGAVSNNQQDAVMNYNGGRTTVQPYRVNTRSASRDRFPDGDFNGLEPTSYGGGDGGMFRQRGYFEDDMDMTEDGHYARMLAGTSPDEDKEVENTDPSTDNGESSGNSLEAQQWSDTEGGNYQGETPCRVSWCELAGKRCGLCWAHGGVKKCCHRNCPKIALVTGEFCSIHEREISSSNF